MGTIEQSSTPQSLPTGSDGAKLGAVPPVLLIPEVKLSLKPFRGAPVPFATSSSVLLFRRLLQAARRAERVVEWSCGGQVVSAETRAALNSYLRTYRVGRGAEFPFHRLDEAGAFTRYQWAVFCRYLDLAFV